MVKYKDPRETREKIIQRDYEFYKNLNFGSEKNIEREENIAVGTSGVDIILNVSPILITDSQEVNEINETFTIEIPNIQVNTAYGEITKINVKVE